MPQLDFSTFPSQLFWLTFFFLIFLGGMVRYFIPRFHNNIDKRQSALTDHIQKTAQLTQETEAMRMQINTRLKTATLDAQKIIQETLQEAHTIKEKQLQVYEEHVKRKLNLSIKEFYQSVEDLKHEIPNMTYDLVIQILGKFSMPIPQEDDIKKVIYAL
jgi:F-type H+-transporting ATPase subunit b